MTAANEEGRRFGVYTGIVANTDDPEQRGRVQLRIPAILGQQLHPAWALPMGAHLGEGTGSLVVPEQGAAVLVMFLDGSPEVPLYMPGPWARGPAEVASDRRVPPTQNRYPRRRMWARSHRGGGWSVTESEQGDTTYANPGRDLSLKLERGRLKIDLRPNAKLVVNEGGTDQCAARKGDAVRFGALSVTPGTGGVAAVLWHPPDGGPPVTLSAVPTTITGLIDEGSTSVLIGD